MEGVAFSLKNNVFDSNIKKRNKLIDFLMFVWYIITVVINRWSSVAVALRTSGEKEKEHERNYQKH